MSKYIYPAVFSYDKDDQVYYVNFPDVDGCYTDGDTLIKAMENAEDVLNLMLLDNSNIKQPTEIKDIKLQENEFATLVKADTLEYRKKINSKAVNKTVTLPQWLNEMSEKANINFSQTLQESLKQKLNLNS